MYACGRFGYYELEIKQHALSMPELLWKAYIDFARCTTRGGSCRSAGISTSGSQSSSEQEQG